VLEQEHQRLFWLLGAVVVSLLTWYSTTVIHYAFFGSWGLVMLADAEVSVTGTITAAVITLVLGSAICWKFRARAADLPARDDVTGDS
jgi:hypothetical protein